jgi:hypothetical protein
MHAEHLVFTTLRHIDSANVAVEAIEPPGTENIQPQNASPRLPSDAENHYVIVSSVPPARCPSDKIRWQNTFGKVNLPLKRRVVKSLIRKGPDSCPSDLPYRYQTALEVSRLRQKEEWRAHTIQPADRPYPRYKRICKWETVSYCLGLLWPR